MQAKPNESILTRLARRFIRWLIVAIILLVALWFAWGAIGRKISRAAVARIAQVTNTRIDTDSVEFHRDGSLLIRRLRVSPRRPLPGAAPILEADCVRARFDLAAAIMLKPRLQEIEVSDFVFNAEYDTDADRWNLSTFKIDVPWNAVTEMPRISLKAGALQLANRSKGRVNVAASVPFSARLGLESKTPGRCEFEIVTAATPACLADSRLTGTWEPGKLTIAGPIASTDLPELEMAWNINAMAAQLNYDANDAYSLKLRIKDLHSRQSLNLDGFARVGPPFVRKSTPFASLRRFFAQYNPSGLADIELNASGNFRRLAQSSISGTLQCRDVQICHNEFAYPISHLTGQIDFTTEGVTLNNLRGDHKDVRLGFDGWSRGFGPNWNYDIRITSDNMALDDDLYDALRPEQKQLWRRLSPAGAAAVDYHFTRRSPTQRRRTLALDLLGTDALYSGFPYPLKNLSGSILFDPNRIVFSDVVSQVDDRRIRINGRVTTTADEPPLYDFSIDVNSMPLDERLRDALPEKQKELYARLRPTGLVDGRITIRSARAASATPDYTADLAFKNASFTFKPLALPVTDITAGARFTPDEIRLLELNGRYGPAKLSLEGNLRPNGDPGRSACQLYVNLTNATLDKDLFDALPIPLRKVLAEIDPRGRVNISGRMTRTDPNADLDYELAVECLGNSVTFSRLPYPLKNVTGKLLVSPQSIQLLKIAASPGDNVWIKANTSAIELDGRISMTGGIFDQANLRIAARDIFFDERLAEVIPEAAGVFHKGLLPTGRFDLNLQDVRIYKAEDGQKYVDLAGDVAFKKCGFKISGARTAFDAVLHAKARYKIGTGLTECAGNLAAERLTVQGKPFANLRAAVEYDRTRRAWSISSAIAECCRGRLTGRMEMAQPQDGPVGYELEAGFRDINLSCFLADTESQTDPQDEGASGRMSGLLSLAATLGDSNSRLGACKLVVTDMHAGKLPPLAKIAQVLQLTEPTDFAFDRMFVDSYIRRNQLLVRKLDLAGRSLAFYGSGSVDLTSRNVDLKLTARGNRLATADPSVLQSLTENLGQAIVRLEVTGNLFDPRVETKALPLLESSLDLIGAADPGTN